MSAELAPSSRISDAWILKTQFRPIVFLAHSLGGIVVKQVNPVNQTCRSLQLINCQQALIRSASHHGKLKSDLLRRTIGILFFGTPHLGSSRTSLYVKLLKFRGIFASTTSHIVKLLAKDSAYLKLLHSEFSSICRNIDIICLYEELAMNATLGVVSTMAH
jgi:hypothetical protein